MPATGRTSSTAGSRAPALAEMRKQLLISPERHEVPEAIAHAKDAVFASPASHVSGGIRVAEGKP